MPEERQLMLATPVIKIDGSKLSEEEHSLISIIEVDFRLDMPSMFIVEFYVNQSPQHEAVDGAATSIDGKLKLGGLVEIEINNPDDPMSGITVIKGEITSLESDFTEGSGSEMMMRIRGYDKSHRLTRESKTKAWLNATDSDIAQSIAGSTGLSPQIEATSEVFKHIYQNSLSDMEFLQQRAMRIGFEFFVSDEKLYFRKPDPTGSAIDLQWGIDLADFRVVASIANQVDEVTVKGWDPLKKEPIIGIATSSTTHPSINIGGSGGTVSKKAISAASRLEVRYPVQSQADANTVAQAVLNQVNLGFVEAEGSILGANPALKAGMLVNVKGIGSQFSGKYKLTSVRHVFQGASLDTYFTVERPNATYISKLLEQQSLSVQAWGGVVTAIVTDNQTTEEDWGTVKVKYPWMSDNEESFWARIVSMGGGNERGWYVMPEINDEVLVAFEHGDFNRPYIIGGLWNGKDTPSEAISDVLDNGKVKTRTFKTRSGHVLRFTDENQPKIELIDEKENTKTVWDTENKKITLTSLGDIELNAQGNIIVTAQGNIEMKATGNLTAESTGNTDLKATGNMTVQGMMTSIKANSNLSLEGTAQAALKGNAGVDIQSPAIVGIMGSLIKLN